MTYVQIRAEHTGDERWLAAGSDAFAVHVWVMSWCDQQLTDGRISKLMAQRVALPVPLVRVKDAIQALLDAGFWIEVNGAYQVVDYPSHALPAAEIEETRVRWNRDKKRQRLHAIGNHSECDPLKCHALLSTKDTTKDTAVESLRVSKRYTKPNQTKPNQTVGLGLGGEPDDSAEPPARRHPSMEVHPWSGEELDISCRDCGLPEQNGVHTAFPGGWCIPNTPTTHPEEARP